MHVQSISHFSTYIQHIFLGGLAPKMVQPNMGEIVISEWDIWMTNCEK